MGGGAALSATTVKVSKSTLRELKQLKRALHARTLEETIRRLVRERRSRPLDGMFGADKGRVKPFREHDRMEDRPL